MRKYFILSLLFLGGCTFSLFDSKSTDKFADIVKEAVKDNPISVTGPPPERIIDWPEIAAIVFLIGGSMAHRYLTSKGIIKAIKRNGT